MGCISNRTAYITYDKEIRPVNLLIFKLRDKKVIWLNPETRGIWTMGDSEMSRYLPYCHVAEECNTLTHVERVLDKLLKDYQSSV